MNLEKNEKGKYLTGITLVVCPLTLVKQWKSEVEKATNPSLRVYIHHGGSRIKDSIKLLKYDIIITTYNTLSYEYNQLLGLTKKKGKKKNI
jgi:SNF2 family DNA or RNA helicase